MAKPRFIAPCPANAPTGASRTSSSTRSIPQDLLLEASRRLGIMSLMGAVLWVLGTLLYRLAMSALGPSDFRWTQFTVTDGIAVVSSLTSLALFAYSRKGHRSPMFILDLGLVYLVATSIALGLVMHWDLVSHGTEPNPMLTWTGVVIIIFSAIVPCAPHKMLVAGLISASMNPLAMLLAKSRGTWDFGPGYYVIVMHYPDFLLVGIAVVISSVVSRLGQQVGKAREMGSYQLVNLLGKGGMGEVWRARHRMLARDAAIKLIQPEMLSDQSTRNASLIQRRFEQEARTTAMLRSPHTVELYDFGVTESGTFYYVMELLDGLDLETLVTKFGPQPPARVVGILRQVCRSLSDAHRHGMIHRDIKPTNIFLCRMGNEYDFAKVLDFGLVKVLDNDHLGMTGEGATTGTPAYMAPEVALGNPIDARTDIYGLGCVAYWLTTGCYVFEEKGATATMLAHVRKPPVPPSQRTEMPVPPSVERTILACLAKEPAERPGSADALIKMLDGAHDAGTWSVDDAAGWWQTHVPESAVPPPTDADPTL